MTDQVVLSEARLKPTRDSELPFASFCEAVRDLLNESAADKGYHRSGLTGPNRLYELVAETAGGPGHAIGEIIYKVRRYAARGDREDLLKVAAWAYLIWQFDRPNDHAGAADNGLIRGAGRTWGEDPHGG